VASFKRRLLPRYDVYVHSPVEASWNVMAHRQKPDLVFRRNGRVNLNRRGRQFSRLLAAEVCASDLIVGSNAGYTKFRGSEKGTGYLLHSPVSPSLPLSCVTLYHHISTGVYSIMSGWVRSGLWVCPRSWKQEKQSSRKVIPSPGWFYGSEIENRTERMQSKFKGLLIWRNSILPTGPIDESDKHGR
jgi:hypothetical protein